VAQLYPRALGSLSVASYVSQGWATVEVFYPACTRHYYQCVRAIVEVEVTLRPTVSRPVCLGVLPLLEQVTICYFYLSDNYFLYFSCRAPFLTRGRVCNLHCNDASSTTSYTATDGLSAISSLCRAPNGEHNQILMSFFDSYLVFSV
jgi:hypothetical protein